MKLLSRLERTRKRLFDRAPLGPGRNYLEGAWPSEDAMTQNCPLLALDLETTGLNPAESDIVSIGWALVDAGKIDLSTARYSLVRPRAALTPSSVAIHGISDDQAALGEALDRVLGELLTDLRGRVLVGHHVGMDAQFLATACRNLGWGTIRFPALCTLHLAERRARRRQAALPAGALTLGGLRRSFGLPNYPEHDALWDAIAAAELWFALEAEISGGASQLRLGSVLQTFP